MKRTPNKIQVHSSHKLRSHHPTVPNMRATVIYVHRESGSGTSGEPLGMVTNDNGRVDEMRVVGARMWRYEVWVEKLGPKDGVYGDGGFSSAEDALKTLMEELGLP